MYAYAANNPVYYTDPDGKCILATANAVEVFRDKNNGIKHISNSYNLKQYYLISNIAAFNKYGKLILLSSYDDDNGPNTKEVKNFNKFGRNVFTFFMTIATSVSKVDDNNIIFESKLIEEKFDDDGNNYYELSIKVDDTKSILFYYSSIEAREIDQLKTLIGEFFTLF